MSRGKPSKAQLDLSMGMMDVLKSTSDLVCEEGVDCRNYGVIDGIKEAKQLLSDMMEVPKEMRLDILTVVETNEELLVLLDKLSAKNYDMTPEEVYQASIETVEETM